MVPADALRWSLVSTRLGPWISVPILATLGCFPLVAAVEQFEGRPIAGIQFEPEKQPLTFDQLLAMTPLHVGQPLRMSDVRDAIEELYKTGEYDDIAVDATLSGQGVNLKFLTKPNFFIGHVGVNGVPEPPTEGQLVIDTKLQLGGQYSNQELETAVDRLADVIRRNGFYHAAVEPQSMPQPAVQQVQINFNIDAGQRARFDGIEVSGQMQRTIDS